MYGTDVDALNPQIGYYYVPIIAWNNGKIIYKIENYSEYEELKQNSVTKEEMNNFIYRKNFTLGKYAAGGDVGTPISIASDPNRAYLDMVIKGNAGDTVVLKTIIGNAAIINVPIRCIDKMVIT